MARHRLTAFRESRSVASLDRLNIDTHDLQVVLEKKLIIQKKTSIMMSERSIDR